MTLYIPCMFVCVAWLDVSETPIIAKTTIYFLQWRAHAHMHACNYCFLEVQIMLKLNILQILCCSYWIDKINLKLLWFHEEEINSRTLVNILTESMEKKKEITGGFLLSIFTKLTCHFATLLYIISKLKLIYLYHIAAKGNLNHQNNNYSAHFS